MSPSPFGLHQAILANLFTIIRRQMDDQACDANAIFDLDWIVRQDTIVRPDLIVVCGDPLEQHLQCTPALVAEVLSPSTRQNDLTYKRELYAREGVYTYLIVDPKTKSIEQLTLSDAGTYDSTDAKESLRLTICNTCQIQIKLADVFS